MELSNEWIPLLALAFVLGARHGLDADHLATIDGLIAKMRQEGAAPAPAAGQRLSPQEAAALPPGTRFIGTDGVERVRQ